MVFSVTGIKVNFAVLKFDDDNEGDSR